MDIEEILTEIKSIKKENERLSQVRERTEAAVGVIDKVMELLRELKNNLGVPKEQKTRSPRRPKGEKLELYEKMQAGVVITSKLLETTYPKWPKYTIYDTMQALSKMPGVRKEKDGNNSRLFIVGG